MSPRSLLTASLLALVLGAALARGAAPPAPAGFKLDGDAGRGKALFAQRCALCHGAGGDAKTKMAESLKPRPADLTNKALMAQRSDWEIYLVIRDGGPAIGLSKNMFGWKGLLPDQAIRDTAAYVRSLSR